MEGLQDGQHVSASTASSNSNYMNGGPSSSSSSTSAAGVEEGGNNEPENEGSSRHRQRQRPPLSSVIYHLNMRTSNLPWTGTTNDLWSCLVVPATFWFLVSMTLIFGLYGSETLQLGPNCSYLIPTNSFFVESIKAEELYEQKPGPMLYGFDEAPSSDVEVSWTETHNASVPVNLYKDWVFFLNKGSKVDVSYSVISPKSSPLSLVIAQGKESFVEWIDDPSHPNTTLSWNIISGSGKIQQEISKSSNYYICVGNLNSEEVEVQLKLTLKAFIYNTSQAYYRCSLGNNLCNLKLPLLGSDAAVLTSPGHQEATPSGDWHVKVSYGPRWLIYFIISGVMTILILLACRFYNVIHESSGGGTGFQAGEMGTERTPLLVQKDDDLSSWGSSYESLSNDEEDLEWCIAESSLEGKPSKEGENDDPRPLCGVCCDAPRGCFFLPCGHCAACFTCGARIAEEAGICSICSRKIKKVRKIFEV